MADYKSDTERAAEFQEKAISIRDYMQEPETMRQLMAALPKWLRADRFIRVFYTAMMQTPKLMECTKQSLLSCMIQAAQIGIEPVFGKAELIPYGKEVQLQLMYKGLMEVARRFADITITGHVVYEIDEFDIEWGDNERIHHKPKFGPDRTQSNKIGAYDIWKVGDEIRSRRFMPASDILFIRDTYSKAWEKDGKKSVWGKHEDDMFLKTVIKGHCKMEPQCIEMERSIDLDDRAELGRSQLGMGRIDELPMPSAFDFKVPDIGGTETGEQPKAPGKEGELKTKAPADVAKAISAQSGLPVKAIKEFISYIAKKQEKTEAWVEENAIKSPESFIRAVQARMNLLKKSGRTPGGNGKAPDPHEALTKEFWNLRVGTGGKTGLKAFVTQHLERIYKVYPEEVRAKLIEKFKAFYPGEIFPAFKEPVHTPPPGQPEKTGISGANNKAPFENPFTNKGEQEGISGEGQSVAEQVGQSIRDAHDEEVMLLAKFDNSVKSVMKFDKSGFNYTLADFESFMMEMAHMEGLTFSSFKADVMRNHQFPDYFDKFIARLSGRDQ